MIKKLILILAAGMLTMTAHSQDILPALDGSPGMLDKADTHPYEWTKMYIAREAGLGWEGKNELIAPEVTFGPVPDVHADQQLKEVKPRHCWLCKVTFGLPGDNRRHCAELWEEPVIGYYHVIDCIIDF